MGCARALSAAHICSPSWRPLRLYLSWWFSPLEARCGPGQLIPLGFAALHLLCAVFGGGVVRWKARCSSASNILSLKVHGFAKMRLHAALASLYTMSLGVSLLLPRTVWIDPDIKTSEPDQALTNPHLFCKVTRSRSWTCWACTRLFWVACRQFTSRISP